MSYPTNRTRDLGSAYAYLVPALQPGLAKRAEDSEREKLQGQPLTVDAIHRAAKLQDRIRRKGPAPAPHSAIESQEVFLSWDELREAFAPGGIRERFQQAVDDALAVRRAEQRIQQLAGLRFPDDGTREVSFLVSRALGDPLPGEGYTPARPLAEAVTKSPRGQFTHNLRTTNG